MPGLLPPAGTALSQQPQEKGSGGGCWNHWLCFSLGPHAWGAALGPEITSHGQSLPSQSPHIGDSFPSRVNRDLVRTRWPHHRLPLSLPLSSVIPPCEGLLAFTACARWSIHQCRGGCKSFLGMGDGRGVREMSQRPSGVRNHGCADMQQRKLLSVSSDM